MSENLPMGSRQAAEAIKKAVTTQLILSGCMPNSDDMMGIAIFKDVDKNGPMKLTRHIE